MQTELPLPSRAVEFSLDGTDPRPVHSQIVDEVQRALVLGTLRPGDPLPPVRHLAADLRVNPGAVARAYRALEAAAVVTVRWGEGPVVAARDGSDRERREVASRVAERALREARRHGFTPEELMQAISDAARGEERP
jgi:GntR family transcriptional regulator